MKEQLKRELNKTYLILSSEDTDYRESYEIEMIVKNAPQAILPLHVLRIDGKIELYYDISSKQTLKDCAGRVKLSADTVRSLFQAIDELIREMKDYLLDMGSILLDSGHIYTREGKFYFCYCPWERQNEMNSFRMLLEEILGDLDYHDTEAVELSYHFYQSVCRGNFHIAEILNEHRKEPEKEKLPEDDLMEYFQEETVEDDYENTGAEKKEKEKNPGILRRILEFFLKKEEPVVPADEEYFEHEELYEGFFMEKPSYMNGTKVLQREETNTVLLQNMPAGSWKLRPLVPGYGEFCITGDSFLVGKKRDCVDGYIGRDTISRIHSRLYVKQDRLFISDANSTNGTFVNGVSIEPGQDVEIFSGDRILFADVGYECYNSV